MIILHLRTVAFICSLSTTIQSIIWIAGYALYMVSYSCGYSLDDFEPDSANSSLSLTDFFVWYYQGPDCDAPSDWITESRGQTSDLLVGLISAGLAWNSALLGLSVAILIALNNGENVMLYSRQIKFYTVSVYIVSIWDVVLVGIVGADIAPLVESSILPFFTGVALISLMLLSRFVVVWIVNIVFATFLLFKKGADGAGASFAPKNPSPPNNEINKSWNNGTIKNVATVPEGEKEYFPRNNGLSSRIVPPPLPDEPPDEVPLRWTQYTGNNRLSDRSSFSDDSEEVRDWRNSSIVSSENKNFDKANWSEAESHIRRSVHNWENSPGWGRNGEPLNTIPVQDVPRTTLEPKRPSFLKNVRNSFRSKSSDVNSPSSVVEEPQITPIKKNEGFTYIPNANPFNVKLRHVNRPSMSKESGKKGCEDSGSCGTEELFYKVSTVTDPNELYMPRVPPVPKEPAPLYSRASQDNLRNIGKAEATSSPPAPPPIQKSSDNHVRQQMSLEEAIRTRGPLRSVKRPAIDTTC